MSSINKVCLMGRLGKDPELKYTQQGNAVCGFSLATHEVWRDKAGEKQESMEWHNISVWGKVGENCSKYLKKGSHVYLEGQIKTDSYEKDGQKRYSTKIVAREVKFLNSKAEHAQGQANAREQTGQGASNLPRNPPSSGTVRYDSSAGSNLEDIPF